MNSMGCPFRYLVLLPGGCCELATSPSDKLNIARTDAQLVDPLIKGAARLTATPRFNLRPRSGSGQFLAHNAPFCPA